MKIECKCGCGNYIDEIDSRGRPHFYIHGHSARISKYAEIAKWKFPKEKLCPVCKKVLQISRFYTRTYRSKTTGESYIRIRSQCKQCEKLSVNRETVNTRRKVYRRNKKLTGNVRHWISERLSDWNSRTTNIQGNLTTDYLEDLYNKQNGLCYYTGKSMPISIGKINQDGLSLDRLDPNKGYTVGNIVFCRFSINTMKGSRTEQEYYDLMKYILEYKKQ
jgi:hypothetical protein